MKNVQHFQAEPIKPRSVSINTIVWNQSGKFETEIKLAHFAWLDCRIGIQFLLEDFLWSMIPRRYSIELLIFINLNIAIHCQSIYVCFNDIHADRQIVRIM